MNDVRRALDSIEVGRQRIAHERQTAANAAANLYKRLGTEDEDVVALDQVLTDWHSMLVRQADDLSEGIRKLAGDD